MKEIYLDNSATTALCDAAKQKMIEAMEKYGNPSSLHSLGLEAEKMLDEARKNVASALGLRNFKDEQIVFTSCGTEASNLALKGCAFAKERRTKNKIITTDSEHPSVENTLKKLEKEGFQVVRISTAHGCIDFDQLEKEADENLFMITMMMVNNETGALYDVKKAFDIARRKSKDVITHTDAVQGFMKCRFNPEISGADLVTLSSHKIHGPKGVGALYISRNIIKEKKIVPVMLGGGQENGFRSGTENVIGIAGFGAAAHVANENLDLNIDNMRNLRQYALDKLSALDVRLNIPAMESAPHIINLTLPQIKSETMLHFLSAKNIFVSSGSACSSHSNHPSSSLIAFGLSGFDADCSLRISLSAYNEKSDIDALCDSLDDGIKSLIKIRR